MIEEYKTVADSTSGEFNDRGSKFISYCFPVNSIKEVPEIIGRIKKEHQKASHYCFAYRIGIDKNIFRANDDGEPYGTAGKPILAQIDGFDLTNVAIVVVRYFGGILLGTGGLINAYREAAKDSITKTTIVVRKPTHSVMVSCDYNLLSELMNRIKKLEIKITDSDFSVNCLVKILADKQQIESLRKLRGITIEFATIP